MDNIIEELEELQVETEELIASVVSRMSKIASAIYGKPVSIRIEDNGEIWYRTEDGEFLSFPDITGRPIMYTNNH